MEYPVSLLGLLNQLTGIVSVLAFSGTKSEKKIL